MDKLAGDDPSEECSNVDQEGAVGLLWQVFYPVIKAFDIPHAVDIIEGGQDDGGKC